MRSAAIVLCVLAAAPAAACDYPDQGNMPLRRAVARVQLLPETEAWSRALKERGGVAQYIVLLGEPVRSRTGRCYWTVELAEDGKLWRRFYVTPDGKKLLAGRNPLPTVD